MIHFAQLDENNVVSNIVSLSEHQCKDNHGECSEECGILFCKRTIDASSTWIKIVNDQSYGSLCARVGDTYDSDLNIFIRPKPHESWTFDSDINDWVSPLGNPPDLTQQELINRQYYNWDEEAYQNDVSDPKTVGWVLSEAQDVTFVDIYAT